MNVPPGAMVPLAIVGADPATRARLIVHEETIKRLARIDDITHAAAAPKRAAVIVAGETTAALPLEGLVDMEAERKRLTREIDKAGVDIGKMKAKLSNPDFMAKAKPEAIEEAQERKAELEGIVARLSAALRRIEG